MAKRKQVQRSTRETGGAPAAPVDGDKKKGMSGKLPWLFIGGGVVAALWAIGSLTNAGVVPAAYLFAYLDFYAGVVVLVSLSITVMIGLAATDRLILTPKHRVLVQGVHRTTGTIAVSFLLLHVTVKILEAHASVIDLVVPFMNPNTLYVGLGTIAAWFLVGVFWSGVARVAFAGKGKPWMWRAVHSIGYLAWPPALGHGLLAGRAAATWVIVSYILCVVGVVIALLVRAITAYGKRINAPKAVPSAAKAAGKAQSGPLEAATGARGGAARPMYRGAVRNQPSVEESLSAPRGAAWGGFSDEGAEQRRQRQTPLPVNALEETQLMSKISRDVVEEAEELVQAAARRPQAPATTVLDEDLIETRPVRRAPRAPEPVVDEEFEDEAPRRPARRPLVPELVTEEPPAARRPRRPEPPAEDDYEEAPAPVRRGRRDPEPELDDDYEEEAPAPRRARRPAAEVPAKPAPRRSRRTGDEEFGEAEISAAATPPRRTRRAVEEPEETAAPRRARRAAEDDDDAYLTREYETVSRRARRAAEEEDEVAAATAPRRARRAADEDVEEEVAIATRPRRARRAADEDEEEDARPRRSHRATEDAEPEVAEVTGPRRARRAVEEEADTDDRAAVDEYWRPPVNPVSRYEEEVSPVRRDLDGDDTPTLVDLASRRAARSARPPKDTRTRRPGRAAADEVSDEEFWARMRGEAK